MKLETICKKLDSEINRFDNVDIKKVGPNQRGRKEYIASPEYRQHRTNIKSILNKMKIESIFNELNNLKGIFAEDISHKKHIEFPLNNYNLKMYKNNLKFTREGYIIYKSFSDSRIIKIYNKLVKDIKSAEAGLVQNSLF